MVEKSDNGPVEGQGSPLTVRPDHRMTYGRVAGLEMPVSRVVHGSIMLDNNRLPYSFEMLDYFYENGGNCIDTAYVYGGGKCEKAVGEWLVQRNIRDKIVLIGKGAHSTSCMPEMITRELSETLDRLQTDYLDIYFMHRDNINLPAGEFVECLNEHHRAGRIRAFGGSNWSPERLAEANEYAASHGLIGFTVSSPNFSLAHWNEPMWSDCVSASEPADRHWYEAHDMALFAWSSQASGFFSGRFTQENRDTADKEVVRVWYNEANFQRLARAEEIGARKGVKATQIALAYVLAQSINIFALIGTRTTEETRTSLLALDVQLTPEELRYLNLED